mgnify:CR=1 FL=1
MERRVLGRTGLEISVMGMGSGGHDPLGQRSGRPVEEMKGLLRRVYDLGINYFDTSPGYLDSERILGEVLRDLPRDELVVSTKIPLAGGHSDDVVIMKPDEVRDQTKRSLTRLGLDHVDVMLMAVAGPEYIDPVLQDHLPVLEQLKQEGLIRFLGSSEQTRSDGSHEWLKKILPTGVIDVAMVGHNMINQSAEHGVFPFCREQNIGVLNIFTVRNLFWNPSRLKEVVDDLVARGKVDRDELPSDGPLDWVIAGDVDSLVDAAYRYALYTEGVTAVMCGTIEVSELERNVETFEKGPLPSETVERLHRIFGEIDEPIAN